MQADLAKDQLTSLLAGVVELGDEPAAKMTL